MENTQQTQTQPGGWPQDSTTGTNDFGTSGADAKHYTATASNGARRLYRTDGPISGVAGGLADYFNIDPVIVRLIIVAGTVVGFPIIPIGYIAAWIIIPKADPAPVPPIMTAPAVPVPPTPHPDAPAPASPVQEPTSDEG